MYVAKFFALNLDLEAPDCSQLGEDPEWVSLFLSYKFFFSCQIFTNF